MLSQQVLIGRGLDHESWFLSSSSLLSSVLRVSRDTFKGKRQRNRRKTAGADDAKDTPVPMPNTEVKLCGAEDTWWETAWENREAPALFLFYRLFPIFLHSSVGRARGC